MLDGEDDRGQVGVAVGDGHELATGEVDGRIDGGGDQCGGGRADGRAIELVDWRFVGTSHGDCQRIGVRGPVAVFHFIREDIIRRRPLGQRLDIGCVVVQGIDVSSIGAQDQCAVSAGDGKAIGRGRASRDNGSCGRGSSLADHFGVAAVDVGVVAEHVAGGEQGAIFLNGGGVGNCHRLVIGACDRDNEPGEGNATGGIGHLINESFGQCAARQQGVNGAARVIDGIVERSGRGDT